jgi:cyanophycin synthetase
MYHINATRILYQTSKYAPVAVLQLDITVPAETGSRAQISESLDRMGGDGFVNLLSLSGQSAAVNIYANLVLGLQRSVGHSVQYYRVQENGTEGEHRVFIEYEEEATALYAAEVAVELLNGILAQQDSSQARQILEEFAAYSRPRTLDSNARLLINAARRQDIPVIRPLLPTSLYASAAEASNSEFQLGWGVHQQHCNGAISERLISLDLLPEILDRAKLYPKLINASLPLPDQDLEFLNRNQARRAQRSARRLGYPVILRPRAIRLFQYRFPEDYVFGPLHNDEQVAMAARHLSGNCGLDVWVESFTAGDLYRFLMINGAVFSVLRCNSPVITGDGVQSIAELTGQLNDKDVLFRVQLTGFRMDSVLEPGIQLALKGYGSLDSGGSCMDVTREMPAHFKELAIKVAEQSGLVALAGVDLIIGDMSENGEKPNCVVSNVVPDPDLHTFEQLSDQPDRIGDTYMAALFPEGTPSRIPTVSVTGTNGKTTTCRMVTQILRAAGLKTGLACTDGVYLDDKLLYQRDSSGVCGAYNLFAATDTEAAVLETARGGLAHTGIVFDHCDVGACTNIASDHLGEEGIETLDDMAVHKRQVIERTTGTVVLNAEDPRCLAMREQTAAGEVILVASSVSHPAIQKHCEAGGKAIAVGASTDTPMIVLLTAAGKITPLMAVNDIPASMGGAAHYNVMNAMFATAIATGLGIEKMFIVAALKTFRMSVETTPGRLNEVTGFPFRVIVDAAHNAHGLKALVGLIDQLPVQGKKIINFGASGNILDENIEAIARQAAGNFDLYIVKNFSTEIHHIIRNRTYEEVPEMLKKELVHQGVPKDKIMVELDVMDSLDRSLEHAKKGDILLVLTKASTDQKFQLIKKLETAAKGLFVNS